MIVIGCDPSTRAPAFAVHDTREPGAWVVVKFQVPKDDALADEVLVEVYEWLEDVARHGETYFAAEDQYQSQAVDPKTGKARANPRTFKALCVARGQIEAAGRLAGCQILEPISPKSWQTAIAGCSARTGRKAAKEASKLRASAITGQKITDADKADAVCIAAYLAHRLTAKGAA